MLQYISCSIGKEAITYVRQPWHAIFVSMTRCVIAKDWYFAANKSIDKVIHTVLLRETQS